MSILMHGYNGVIWRSMLYYYANSEDRSYMYLKQSRFKNGRIYLSLCESYLKDKISKTRTVRSLGYLDDLEKLYEDPIAHFKAEAAKLTEEQRKADEPVLIEFYPKEKIDMRTDHVKNLGHAVLSFYYHRLRIDRFWDNRRMRGDFDYNPNAIFKLLVYERILDPGSKARAFRNKHLFSDRMDFTQDDMYRCLSFLSGYERALISWIDKAIGDLRKRKDDIIYYDVTNYYFEIEREDVLRRRGVSKEHRPNPIIQMGLALDEDGLPLDYRLFEGNTNDCLTLLPVLKDLKAQHGGVHVIVVADKGLNTSDNIAANILDRNGFVFSQSVRHGTAALKEWVCDESGYTGGDDFKIKGRMAEKTLTIEDSEGKRKKIAVEVREVAFWSRDFAVRSKAERKAVIEKSLAYVQREGIGTAKAHTAVRYVNDIAVVKDTGEAAEHIFEFDTDKIAADEAMDGYYCLITNELDKTPGEIIDIYRGLWRIEETFRVTKSTLETRPVYVSRHDRIHAHFMTCYVALVLLRLIQSDLGWQHSAQEIAEDLSAMNGTLMKKNYYLFGHRTHLSDELGRLCGIDLSRDMLSTEEIRNILAKTKRS